MCENTPDRVGDNVMAMEVKISKVEERSGKGKVHLEWAEMSRREHKIKEENLVL